MRILLINPNTTESITELVTARARDIVGQGAEITAATGRFGARYVASRAAYAIAGHAALDALAEHHAGCDAVLLACFGDPGLLALKELSPIPVVGMAEASCHLACLIATRFSIVTGGPRWGPMLQEFVAGLGLSARLASIRTIAPSGAEIASDPDRALAALAENCRECVTRDGAEAIVLGGAGLAGLADRIAPQLPVPVICSLEAGLRAAMCVARLRVRKGDEGSLAKSMPAETSGLSGPLAALLRWKVP